MKRAYSYIALVFAIMFTSGCSLQTNTFGVAKGNPPGNNLLLQPVANSEIEKIRAAKMDFEKPGVLTIKNIDLTLTESQTKELINWYNSIPENRVFKIDEIEGSIKLGVVLELKEKTELRIQYTSAGEVFVTVSYKGTKKYRIEMPEIKPLFDQLLK